MSPLSLPPRRTPSRARTVPWGIRWRSRITRRARALGVLLLIAGALSTLLLPSGSGADGGAEVLVAAGDQPVGHVLTAEDLRIVDAAGGFAASADAPDARRLREELEGAVLAVPVRSGQQLASGMVLGPGLAEHLPEGQVATSVRARDPQALALLRVGGPVTVIGATAEGGAVEVAGTLLWAPRGAAESTTGLGGGEEPTSRLALVAVTPQDARRLAGLSGEATVVMGATSPATGESAESPTASSADVP